MTKKNLNINIKQLQTSIILGTVFISASMLFLGYSISKPTTADVPQKETISDDTINQRVQEGIERYVAKQQVKQAVPTVDKITEVSIDDDAMLGDPNAPVTLIEFSDYECPFCKRYYTQTYPEIKKNYVDKGLVRIVFRNFPLSFHDPLSTQEAMAAECAKELGDDKTYYAYHDLIFDNTTSNGRGLIKSQLYDFASQLNLNSTKFKECLDSEKYKEEVQKDLADGQRYGVSGTPGFFINGRELKGAQPYSRFKAIIDEELSK